jgi:hypothetical protein
MARRPLASLFSDLVSGGGGGVLDFVCAFAMDGPWMARSAQAINTGVSFMGECNSVNGVGMRKSSDDDHLPDTTNSRLAGRL